jgi:Tfp pilus assembly protein PilZ
LLSEVSSASGGFGTENEREHYNRRKNKSCTSEIPPDQNLLYCLMQPERKNKRYKLNSVEIKSRMLLARYVKILNMSIGGIAVQTDKRMTVGNQYTLKIESKGQTLNVKGVVVWSVLGESIKDAGDNIIPIYTAGMKFTDTSPEKTGEIVDFIEAHKRDVDKEVDLYSPSGLRLHVRIHIEDPEKAVLDSQEGYRVRNLSFSGMLMESEHPFETGSKLPMEITLSEKETIRVSGRVVSCTLMKGDAMDHYHVGIEFQDISAKDRKILKAFLLSYSSRA